MTATIWFNDIPPTSLSIDNRPYAADHMGVEFVAAGPDYLCGRMPIDHRTHQPMGLLHGGMSLFLAETIASFAANFVVDNRRAYCVGQEINGNHVRSASTGYAYATAKPAHIGKRSHVWHIDITDDNQRVLCIARMTAAVLAHKR